MANAGRYGALTDADFRGCRWIEGDPTPGAAWHVLRLARDRGRELVRRASRCRLWRRLGIGCLVPTDHRDLDPLSGPLCCLTEIIAEVLNEAEKIVPITAADASGHIEAALRLHQPPSRDNLVMIAGVALAAAASIDRSAACYFASGAAPGSLIH